MLGRVLIWINGAFGAGKTHTAFELQRRLSDAHVADPELLGYAIHRMLPPAARADFQDRPVWRSSVVGALTEVAATHDGPVIVPMTLVESAYFDEIMGGLADAGVAVRHVALIVSPETLHQRLRTRGAYWLGKAVGRDETWAMAQAERCITALAEDRFADHVDAERPLDEVVEDIADRVGLPLVEPRLGSARAQLRRVAVGVRHLHF